MYWPEPKAALQGGAHYWVGGLYWWEDGQGLCRAVGGGSGISEAVKETRAVLAFLT